MQQIAAGPAVTTEALRAELGSAVVGWELNTRSDALRRLVVGLVLIVVGAGIVVLAWSLLGADHLNLLIVTSILGVMCAIGGASQLVSSLAATTCAGRQVFVFDRGLVSARNDRVTRTVSFLTGSLTERRVVYERGGTRRLEIDAWIKDHGTGQVFTVGGDLDFRQAVTEELQRRVAVAKLQPCLDLLAGGGAVDFGTIRLTGRGFTTPGAAVTDYADVRSLAVSAGQWVIIVGDVIKTEVTGKVNDTVDFRLFCALLAGRTQRTRQAG